MARWRDDDEWGNDHHPPCRCGCGELADECAGPRPNPLGSMTITPPRTGITLAPLYPAGEPYDVDVPTRCRWHSGCSEPAERGGFCDVHLATL